MDESSGKILSEPDNDTGPIVHSRGFPAWGPPTLCGEPGLVIEVCGWITCEACNAIHTTPGGLAARCAELEREIGKARDPRKPTAPLSASSPRADLWMRVYGTLTVPILSPVSTRAELPDLGVQEVYQVDVSALGEEQIDRVVLYLADRFGLTEDDVRAGLLGDVRAGVEAEGLPILADHVAVSFHPHLLLDDDEDPGPSLHLVRGGSA